MASEKKSSKKKNNEEILVEFQTLRNEQRVLANKLSEMEMELNEHKYESTTTYTRAFFFMTIVSFVNTSRKFDESSDQVSFYPSFAMTLWL